MSQLIKCPNCHNQVEQSNYCQICGSKIQSTLYENHYSNKEKEAKIIINQKSGFISGLSQGVGCVVGILLAILVVLFLFFKSCDLLNANSISANRDAVISDLNNFGTMAQQYYKKPSSMGGGNNSFNGWSIPNILKSTANGNYTSIVNNDQQITIIGIGTEIGQDQLNKIKITATITPTTINTVTDN